MGLPETFIKLKSTYKSGSHDGDFQKIPYPAYCVCGYVEEKICRMATETSDMEREILNA